MSPVAVRVQPIAVRPVARRQPRPPLAVKITTRGYICAQRSTLPRLRTDTACASTPQPRSPRPAEHRAPRVASIAERWGPSGPPVKIDNHDLGSAQTRPHSRTVGYAVDLELGKERGRPPRPSHLPIARTPGPSSLRGTTGTISNPTVMDGEPRPYSGRDGSGSSVVVVMTRRCPAPAAVEKGVPRRAVGRVAGRSGLRCRTSSVRAGTTP